MEQVEDTLIKSCLFNLLKDISEIEGIGYNVVIVDTTEFIMSQGTVHGFELFKRDLNLVSTNSFILNANTIVWMANLSVS